MDVLVETKFNVNVGAGGVEGHSHICLGLIQR